MKMSINIYLFPLYLILLGGTAYAQGYDGSPCKGGDDRLRALVKKEIIKELYIDECAPNPGPIATSFLKASGKAPVSIKDPNFKPPPEWSEADGDEKYDRWTCMYAGSKITDGDVNTAWVEGVPGDGKGELILIPTLDLFKSIEIHAGFGKDDILFQANSRPKKINLHILRAQAKGLAQCGVLYENITWIASEQIVLQDVNRFQPLALPAFKKESFVREGETRDYRYWLVIEIVDVYPGSKYQDTCISEIRNVKLAAMSKESDLATVKKEIEGGADVNGKYECDPRGRCITYLSRAAFKGEVDVMKYLIAKGAKVNETGLFEVTPLVHAAGAGNVDAVQALLDAGADPGIELNEHGERFKVIDIARKEGGQAKDPAVKERYDKIISLLEKNSRVKDVNRDAKNDIAADKAMTSAGTGKGDVPGGIPEGFLNVGDLNDDGIPELMKTDEEYFREQGTIRRTISAWNAAEKKYKPTQLAAVTKSSGACNSDNLVENMSFDLAAKPFPAVLIKRKYWKSDEKCGERVVIDKTDNYQWNAVFKDYVTLLSDIGGGEQVAVRRASVSSEELPVQKIVLARGGAVKELSKSFDVKTVLSGFEIKGEFVYFKAEDDEWKSDYAWRVSDGTLHFMAQNKKTGKTVYSKPQETNVFRKQGGH